MAPSIKRRRATRAKTGKRKDPENAAALTALSRTTANIQRSVSIIGAGKLGTAFALALAANGYAIEAVVTRRIQSARRTVNALGTQTQALSATQFARLSPSDILLITTPDDAIEAVAEQLTSAIKWTGRGRIALHASGALSSEALNSLRAIGFHIGSMHPLTSVSDSHLGAERLRLAHFCIEGQPPAVRVASSIVRALGGWSFSIQTRDKALYHAAAVMTSGHVVALFDIATALLTRCGLTDRQASEVLLPLLRSTVENLSRHTPARALTGTFARADTATVRKHLTALLANSDSDALAAYKLLGLRSLLLARENGADIVNLKKIKRILEEVHR